MNIKKLLLEEIQRDSILGQYVKPDGSVDLWTYTNALGENGGVLSPTKAKENAHYHSRNDWNVSDVPRVFFYLDPREKENMFRSIPLYKVTVPASQIASFESLSPEFVNQSRNQYGRLDFNKFLQSISGWFREEMPGTWKLGPYQRKDGVASGFAYKTQHFKVVIWFDDIQVERVPESMQKCVEQDGPMAQCSADLDAMVAESLDGIVAETLKQFSTSR